MPNDLERSGLGAIERDLRENLFGDEAWSGLEPAARSFIASAEKAFRDHRGDPAFDFTGVLVDFAKAFEVQGNALLRRVLANAPRDVKLANVEGRTVDLARADFLSLGQLARVIADNKAANDWLKRRLRRQVNSPREEQRPLSPTFSPTDRARSRGRIGPAG